MSSITVPQFQAGGDIRPARFVKLSGAADFTVLEADANERVFGIATDATRDPPLPNASALAAAAGDQLRIHGVGEETTIELGSGGATRGAMLVSDADGKAVAAASTGTTVQWIGAEALESGLEGELIRVVVRNFPFRPALT